MAVEFPPTWRPVNPTLPIRVIVHMDERIKDPIREITPEDVELIFEWLRKGSMVPPGPWVKFFPGCKLVGRGRLPSSILTKSMAHWGTVIGSRRTAATSPVNPEINGFRPWFNAIPTDEDLSKRYLPQESITSSPEFEQWFSGSQVVDDAGKPLVAYHGTASKSKGFVQRGGGAYAQMGFWFDASPHTIKRYMKGQIPTHTPNTIPVYLAITHPKEYAGLEMFRDACDGKFGATLKLRVQVLRKELKKAGYDGVVIRNDGDTGGVDYWVAFKNTQIKSAIGNSGAFDGEAASILASTKSPVQDNSAFKTWFGDSKVVDAEGNPQVVYHGTDKKFTTFSTNKATMGNIWFTSDRSAIENGEVGAAGSGHILELYVSLQNPAGWSEYEKLTLGELRSRGYDGAILPNGDGHFTGFVFKPTQLKSATRNKGTFNPEKGSIVASKPRFTASFLLQARPTESKIEYLTKQFKLTTEQINECVELDPSPNQTDFVPWIARWVSKEQIRLPEDGERIKEQLTTFQKLKRSPNFEGNKDVNSYNPGTLFTALEENSASVSKKEQERETVYKGASVIINQQGFLIYKVTERQALMSLSGGTNWCTAQSGMASSYLQQGPSYVIFKDKSAFAQLHPPSNQYMDRTDVSLLDKLSSTRGTQLGYIFNEEARRAVELLATKAEDVKAWFQEHSATKEQIIKEVGFQRLSPDNMIRLAMLKQEPIPLEDEARLKPDQYGTGPSIRLLTQYAGRFKAGQRWPPLEEALLKGRPSQELVTYARKNIGGRWTEGEKKILRSVLTSRNSLQMGISYAKSVIRGRWPEMEKKFDKANPSDVSSAGAFEYAKEILKKPWSQLGGKQTPTPAESLFPDAAQAAPSKGDNPERLICFEFENAVKYAEELLQGPFPLFEKLVTSNETSQGSQYHLLEYCDKVAKKRVLAIEKRLISDIGKERGGGGDVVVAYARKMIGGRWPEAEGNILATISLIYNANSYETATFELDKKYDFRDSWRTGRLPGMLRNYLEKVVKGRWSELETLLLERYTKFHKIWNANQHLLEDYLAVLNTLGTSWPEGDATLRSRSSAYETYLLKQAESEYFDGGLVKCYQDFVHALGERWPEGAAVQRKCRQRDVERYGEDTYSPVDEEKLDKYYPKSARLHSAFLQPLNKGATPTGSFPTKTFPKLWHVGHMDASKKRRDSHEGAGLSVSVNPHEWQQINSFTAGPLWELTKSGNRFLAFHRLTKKHTQALITWGVQQGYCQLQDTWEVSWYDDELEDEVALSFNTLAEAQEQAGGEKEDIRKVPGSPVSTSLLQSKAGGDASNAMVVDLLATLYAEEVMHVDGVWWADRLDVSAYSAPRGVICNSQLASWTKTQVVGEQPR